MRRALDTGLVLLLAGGLALAGAPAAFAGSPKPPAPASRRAGLESEHPRGGARVHFVAVAHNGREHRGQHFTAARVRFLTIRVEWPRLAGSHTQRLDLIAPDGAVYQRFTSPVETVEGRATVETRLPVAGTWITEFSLEGRWTVNVYRDSADTPSATATFTLSK